MVDASDNIDVAPSVETSAGREDGVGGSSAYDGDDAVKDVSVMASALVGSAVSAGIVTAQSRSVVPMSVSDSNGG
jgi:hypothetical protein